MAVVLVTGGSRGIGAGICRVLGTAGHTVYVGFHERTSAAQRVAGEVDSRGGKGRAVQVDLTVADSVASVMEAIEQQEGVLNCVVSNAAVDTGGDLDSTTLDAWNAILNVKLTGAFLVTKYSLPLLKRSASGQVIYITSNEADHPQPDYLAYGVATGGLVTFAKAMSRWLPKHGVRANCVAPGTVRTELWGDAFVDDDLWGKLAEQNPMGRVPTPEDVGETCLMLLEDRSRYLNGNTIYVNGGNHI